MARLDPGNSQPAPQTASPNHTHTGCQTSAPGRIPNPLRALRRCLPLPSNGPCRQRPRDEANKPILEPGAAQIWIPPVVIRDKPWIRTAGLCGHPDSVRRASDSTPALSGNSTLPPISTVGPFQSLPNTVSGTGMGINPNAITGSGGPSNRRTDLTVRIQPLAHRLRTQTQSWIAALSWLHR